MAHIPLAAKKSAQRLQIQHVALIRANNQTDISHHQKHSQTKIRPLASGHTRIHQNQRSKVSPQNPQNRSSSSPNQSPQTSPPQPHLEKNHSHSKQQPANRSQKPRQAKRLKVITGGHANNRKDQPHRQHVPKRANISLRRARKHGRPLLRRRRRIRNSR